MNSEAKIAAELKALKIKKAQMEKEKLDLERQQREVAYWLSGRYSAARRKQRYDSRPQIQKHNAIIDKDGKTVTINTVVSVGEARYGEPEDFGEWMMEWHAGQEMGELYRKDDSIKTRRAVVNREYKELLRKFERLTAEDVKLKAARNRLEGWSGSTVRQESKASAEGTKREVE